MKLVKTANRYIAKNSNIANPTQIVLVQVEWVMEDRYTKENEYEVKLPFVNINIWCIPRRNSNYM